MRSQKTLKMVQLAILTAVVLILAFTPIGYLRIGVFAISFLTIPVAIGAMVIGPGAGAFLGTIFGITSFIQCFGLDAFGTMMLSINPFFTFLFCVPTRTLMGLCTGLVYKKLAAWEKTRAASCFIGGALAAVFNTVFFMTVLVLCFWNTEYIQGLNESMGGKGVIAFVLAFVGVNFIFEVIVACLASGTIVRAVKKGARDKKAPVKK